MQCVCVLDVTNLARVKSIVISPMLCSSCPNSGNAFATLLVSLMDILPCPPIVCDHVNFWDAMIISRGMRKTNKKHSECFQFEWPGLYCAYTVQAGKAVMLVFRYVEEVEKVVDFFCSVSDGPVEDVKQECRRRLLSLFCPVIEGSPVEDSNDDIEYSVTQRKLLVTTMHPDTWISTPFWQEPSLLHQFELQAVDLHWNCQTIADAYNTLVIFALPMRRMHLLFAARRKRLYVQDQCGPRWRYWNEMSFSPFFFSVHDSPSGTTSEASSTTSE